MGTLRYFEEKARTRSRGLGSYAFGERQRNVAVVGSDVVGSIAGCDELVDGSLQMRFIRARQVAQMLRGRDIDATGTRKSADDSARLSFPAQQKHQP